MDGGDQLSGTSLKLRCHQAKVPSSVLNLLKYD